jgi:hypothetical protein
VRGTGGRAEIGASATPPSCPLGNRAPHRPLLAAEAAEQRTEEGGHPVGNRT